MRTRCQEYYVDLKISSLMQNCYKLEKVNGIDLLKDLLLLTFELSILIGILLVQHMHIPQLTMSTECPLFY